jgi:hypothetical protein
VLTIVGGTGRCGSTPVAEIVARHPATGFVSNLDDKLALLDLSGRWNGRLFRRSSARDPKLLPFRDRSRLLERGRARIAPSEAWTILDRHVMPSFSLPCRDLVASDLTPWLANRLHGFIDKRMAAQQASHFVLHLTGWPRTGLLQAAYPDARVVNVVRDGRAVANSWLHMGWWDGYQGPSKWYLGPLSDEHQEEWEASGRSFVVLAGLGWKRLMDASDAARAAAPAGQWLDVRYEDLVADPRGQAKAILEFLGLEWTPEYEKGFSRCVFTASRVEAFRRDIDPANLTLLDRSLAGHLERWGYAMTRTS